MGRRRPSGSFEKKLTTATLGRVQAAPGAHAQIVSGNRVKVRGLFSCGGSAPGIHVNGDVSVSLNVDAGADWSLFHGVTDAHLIATASATATVGVSADASADCDLGPITLFKTDLGAIDIQAGPIPVILTPVITNQFAGIGWINTKAANLYCANTSLGGPLCQEFANVPLHEYGGSFVNSDGTPGTVNHLSVTVDCTFYSSSPCPSNAGPANNIELVATLSDGSTVTVHATSDPDTLTVNANGIVSYVTQPIDGVSDYAYGIDTVTFSQ